MPEWKANWQHEIELWIKMFNAKGKLHYDDTEGFRVFLNVDQDISEYYRALIPKYYRPLKPRYDAHITVVRPGFDEVNKHRHWGDYEGEEIEFIYDSYPLHGMGYFWLNAWSKRLEEIRLELGLINTSKYALRPSGYDKTFHITIAKYVEIFDVNSAPEK